MGRNNAVFRRVEFHQFMSDGRVRRCHESNKYWNNLLSRLPRRPAEPLEANPQATSTPNWPTVTPTPARVGLSNPLPLTHGAVISHTACALDITANYVNGSWMQIMQIASLPSGYDPDVYACAVLPDGSRRI
jgi:hypothetical protein